VASRLLAAFVALLLFASPAAAVDSSFPDRPEGQHVFDRAELLEATAATSIARSAERLLRDVGIDLVVMVRVRPETDSFEAARAQAEALVEAWSIGTTEATDALVILVDLDESRCHGQFQFYADEELRLRFPDDQRQAIYDSEVEPLLAECDLTGAVAAAVDAAESELVSGAPSYSDEPTYPAIPPDLELPPDFGFEDRPADRQTPFDTVVRFVQLGFVLAAAVIVVGVLRSAGIGGPVGPRVPFVGHSHDDRSDDEGPIGGPPAGGPSGSPPGSPPSGGNQGGAGGRF
jgi:uncharacterized membrane protein YgcG